MCLFCFLSDQYEQKSKGEMERHDGFDVINQSTAVKRYTILFKPVIAVERYTILINVEYQPKDEIQELQK
jgi:hypothetical protein